MKMYADLTGNCKKSRIKSRDDNNQVDIDIDCIESDRPAIFKYIIDRFGKEKTARVASFGTMQSKAVIDGIGRYFAKQWEKEHPGAGKEDNPYSIPRVKVIKNEFEADEEKARKKYKELFYYYDGLASVKVSQSVHPAGMVISPISLDDHFGTFNKDGDECLLLDMENIHDYTGLAKYDFLVLSTVEIIRDTFNYLGKKYPKTYEINWDDQEVWEAMLESPIGVFQFESAYAFQCLEKFKPHSIFDMALVTAAVRPSGASYRDDLLAHKRYKNPSPIIDELLSDSLNYLVFQEQTIKFLQQICGLSGSEADNIRRAIGQFGPSL